MNQTKPIIGTSTREKEKARIFGCHRLLKNGSIAINPDACIHFGYELRRKSYASFLKKLTYEE